MKQMLEKALGQAAQRTYCKGFAIVLKINKRTNKASVLLWSPSFQIAAFRCGDVECVGGGEEVSLVHGAVVVRRQVRVQEGGQRVVGGAFFQAVGVQVKQKVQFVLDRLHLNKHTKQIVSYKCHDISPCFPFITLPPILTHRSFYFILFWRGH